MKAWIWAVLLVAVAIGGCVEPADKDADGGDDVVAAPQRLTIPEDPMPEGADHDHGDPGLHKFLWNYDFSARDPLMQDAANVAGLHALDVQAGYLFGAVYGAHAASVNGGLVIWDLADPANPVEVGRWTVPGSVGGDRSMEATPDGNFAVLSTEPVTCAGHVNPAGVIAAYLIDTSDKTNPIVADVMTANLYTAGQALEGTTPGAGFELGQHSVAVHNIQGEDYAFIWGKIFRIDRGEQGGALVYVSTINAGHDIYVRDTPWGTTWSLAAGAGGSLVVTDVTDPAVPFEIGVWSIPEDPQFVDEGAQHYLHTADVSFQDGQIVIVQTSEDFAEQVSPLWVIDGNPLAGITDEPAEPVVLETIGRWHNPGEHNALTGLTFSLHNPRFHDGGILTLSSYHGGMWQLDIRHPEFWLDPAPMAYAVFAEGDPTMFADPVESEVQSRLCGLEIALDAPSYWDVEVGVNGVTYLADGFMGLYTFVPSDTHPVYGANRTMEWPGTAGL